MEVSKRTERYLTDCHRQHFAQIGNVRSLSPVDDKSRWVWEDRAGLSVSRCRVRTIRCGSPQSRISKIGWRFGPRGTDLVRRTCTMIAECRYRPREDVMAFRKRKSMNAPMTAGNNIMPEAGSGAATPSNSGL